MRPWLIKLAVVVGFAALGMVAAGTGSTFVIQVMGAAVVAWLAWNVFQRIRDLYSDT